MGLTEVQRARVALNRAMAERTDLPTRFTADPVRTAILISSTETLDAFASGLSELAPDAAPLDLPPLDDRIGGLTLPAQGIILRSANEADAAGIIRPGILLATRPGALVLPRPKPPFATRAHCWIMEMLSSLNHKQERFL